MSNKKLTILLVEDEVDIRNLYIKVFSMKGLNVIPAKNGKEALVQLKKNSSKIDLVVLDIVMPDMDGFDVLRGINKDENYKKIPVIVSSNLDEKEDREEALKLGAFRYIVKSSVIPADVVDMIAEICYPEKKKGKIV